MVARISCPRPSAAGTRSETAAPAASARGDQRHEDGELRGARPGRTFAREMIPPRPRRREARPAGRPGPVAATRSARLHRAASPSPFGVGAGGGSIIAHAQSPPAAHNSVSAAQAAWKLHVGRHQPSAGDQADEGTDLERMSPRFDREEAVLLSQGRAAAEEQRFVRAGAEAVADRDEHAGDDELGDTGAQPAEHHRSDLDDRSEEQARPVSEPVGEPAGRNFQQQQRDVAGREDRGHDVGRQLLLLHPPQQVEAMRDAFEAGDAIRQVQRNVPAVAGSVRRHWPQSSRISTSER